LFIDARKRPESGAKQKIEMVLESCQVELDFLRFKTT
jgi:hypothetical protein